MTKLLISFSVIIIAISAGVCYHHADSSAGIKLTKSKTGTRYEEFAKAIEEEERLLRDPRTGKIPPGIRELEMAQAREIFFRQASNASIARVQANTYSYQGPNNLGGRTRSIAFDINDATSNTMIAGSVSGGVFRTTNGGTSWNRVSPNSNHFSVTTIAQDTRAEFTDTWYYGGGESLGNSASASGAFYFGDGVYKSTDNGLTWNKLASSNTGSLYAFDSRADFIHKIAVHPITGDIYMACAGAIRRSQNGGASWSDVMTTGVGFASNSCTDVLITSTGRVYVAFGGTNNSAASNGVWTSATGNAGSYTQISGSAIATPAGWNAYNAYGRIVLAVAPSNENLVFAIYYNNVTSNCTTPAAEAEFFKWDEATDTWTDLSSTLPDEGGCTAGNDPFAVQGGYDIAIAIKPDDVNTIVLGGTNVYRSVNGGTSWTRIGGYDDANGYDTYLNHHPDIHVLKFFPSNASQLVCGSDGGVHKTDISAGTVSWTALNNNYQTYQYYHVAIKQEAGVNDFIGGAQDNGTTVTTGGSTNFSPILGGDGVAVGFGSGAAPYKQFAGFQYGAIYRRNSSLAASFIEADLKPAGVVSNFVTYFLLDPDNPQNLYYSGTVSGNNKVLRITNASTANLTQWQTFDFNFDGYVHSMATTRGTYTPASRLYFGTGTGRLYRLNDPRNAALSEVPVDITPTGMVNMGTVISIAINPQNQNELLVTYSNYGTTNIWHTTDAGSATPTWTDVEGNLTLPSVRSAMIIRNSTSTEYYVGTSVGLYKATTLIGSGTVWNQEAVSEIGNAVVTGLSLRTVDNTFAIGTHGSGMWKGVAGVPLPVRLAEFTGVLKNNSVQLQWTTQHEQENAGFEIERSYNGQQFTKIGFVKGRGNSSVSSRYVFDDKDIALNENFYRLRQVDMNGSATYSAIVLVKNTLLANGGFRVLGNPFTHYIDLQLPKNISGNAVVSLIDMTGRIAYRQRIKNTEQRVRLMPPANLLRGAYLLQLADGEEQFSWKVIKE